MNEEQGTLFGAASRAPDGFRYQPNVLSLDEESALLERVAELPFKNFEFHGFVGKRRVVSYGWRYDFSARTIEQAEDIPDFLGAVRETAGRFAEVPATTLQQVLVTEYEKGASIGWHRDKAVFGDVIGISLRSACTFRLRRQAGASWERYSVIAEPRSAYLLRGASRTEWEHSIPAVDARRFSITFRNLRPPRAR
jgi:alkylated DNA repair dioxygenase AlkB